jgi:ATP-dependent Lon protease
MEFIITAPLDKKNNKKSTSASAAAIPSSSQTNKKNIVPEPTHNYSTRYKKGKEEEYKKNVSSSSEEDEDDEEEDEEEEPEEEEEVDYGCIDKNGKLDNKKYEKLLSELFPSKYMNEKVEQRNSGNKKMKGGYITPPLLSPIYSSSPRPPKLSIKNKNKSKGGRKLFEEEEEDEEEEDYEEEDYDDRKRNKKGKNSLENMLKGGSKFNIIFTLGGAHNKNKNNKNNYFDEEYDEEDDEDYDPDADEDYDEDASEADEDEDDYDTDASEADEDASEADEDADEEADTTAENSANTSANASDEENDTAKANANEAEADSGYNKLKEMVEGLSEKERKSKSIRKIIAELEKQELERKKKQKRLLKKQKTKNTNNFKKLLREKNVMNDVRFFKDKMSADQQVLVIKQLEEITKYSDVDKPYRLALIDSDIPIAYKACAIKKINTLRYMDPGAGEYYKIKNWVDTFMQIPFGKNKVLPLTINDGIEKCHDFMEKAKNILDDAVYGLSDAKLQIMQMIGQWLVNPEAIGTAIAIKGPMGTGKTTLVKEGISKILGRDFAFIALGGATDSSFLEGHSYTYEGSSWGKIVDILISSKSMNPVIYFDELDKVSDTPKGEEIIGILTHLTDTTQNNKFHDKYFAGIDFDISRCLFIFSYNDESKVNPILRDRMYRIHTKGYDGPQKTIISNNHLLPKIREQVAFKSDEIIVPDETIQYIINTHTEKEDGVRNLKRCLEIIHTKLNLYRLMKPGVNLFDKDDNMKMEVTFPITVTPEIVDKLIKKSTDSGAWTAMYS